MSLFQFKFEFITHPGPELFCTDDSVFRCPSDNTVFPFLYVKVSKFTLLIKIFIAKTSNVFFSFIRFFYRNVYHRENFALLCLLLSFTTYLRKSIALYFWHEYYHAVNMVSDNAEYQNFFYLKRQVAIATVLNMEA